VAEIKKSRLDAFGCGGIAFYSKFKDDDGQVMFTLKVDGENLSYYIPGSRILTPKETQDTRDTTDFDIGIGFLDRLFRRLISVFPEGDTTNLIITKGHKKLIIEEEPEDTQELDANDNDND
jgi:hypothetical protein